MKCVQFYREEIPNHLGCYLSFIMHWSDYTLEADHDYIQWMFPSNEPSQMNDEAPVLTFDESEIFKNDPVLKEKIKKSFERFLEFLGFRLTNDDQIILVDRSPSWIVKGVFDHNIMRVTRVFKCLRLTGNDKYAKLFYEMLKRYKSEVSENTWNHWTNAVEGDLW